jgi:hypothetical protein
MEDVQVIQSENISLAAVLDQFKCMGAHRIAQEWQYHEIDNRELK